MPYKLYRMTCNKSDYREEIVKSLAQKRLYGKAITNSYFVGLSLVDVKELMAQDSTVVMSFLFKLLKQYINDDPLKLGDKVLDINCFDPNAWQPFVPYYNDVIKLNLNAAKRQINTYFEVKGILIKYKKYVVIEGQEYSFIRIVYTLLKDVAAIKGI